MLQVPSVSIRYMFLPIAGQDSRILFCTDATKTVAEGKFKLFNAQKQCGTEKHGKKERQGNLLE